MTINLKIVNLIKRHQIYTNQELYKVINNFNHSQSYLHLEFDHYDLDRFVVEIEHNQLKLGYVSHPGHQVYFDHPEDSNRNYLTYQQSKARAKNATIEFLDASNIDFMLTRFGPLFNNNGLAVVKAAQELGINLSNTYQGIANCRDKLQAYLQVRDLVPLVDSSYLRWTEMSSLPRKYFSYPRVSKPNSKSLGGERVRLSYDQRQLVQHAYDLDPYDFVFNQEFIQSSEEHTFDLRVMVLNGKVRGSFLRVADPSSIVTNISKGGCAVPYSIDPLLEQQALAITRRLGLDISGLDFIYNPELQQWQFLEANACPGYFAYDHVLNKSFAQELLDYMLIRMTGQKASFFMKELSEEELQSLKPLTALEAIVREQELLLAETKNQQQKLFTQAQELLQASIQERQADSSPAAKDSKAEESAYIPLTLATTSLLNTITNLPNLEDLQEHRTLARQEVELAKLSQQASLQEPSNIGEAVVFNYQAKDSEQQIIKVPLEQEKEVPIKNGPSPEIAALEASFKNIDLTLSQHLEDEHTHLKQLNQEQEIGAELGKAYHENQIKKEIKKILPVINPGVTTAIPGYGNPLLDQSLEAKAVSQDLAGLETNSQEEAKLLTSQLVNALNQNEQTIQQIKATELELTSLPPQKIISTFNQADFEQKSINFNLAQELSEEQKPSKSSTLASPLALEPSSNDSSLDLYLQHEQEVNSLGEALLLEQGKEEVKGLKEQTLQTIYSTPKKLVDSLELQTLEKSLLVNNTSTVITDNLDNSETATPEEKSILTLKEEQTLNSLDNYIELINQGLEEQRTIEISNTSKENPFSTVNTSPYVTNKDENSEEDLLTQEAKNNTLDPAFSTLPEKEQELEAKDNSLSHTLESLDQELNTNYQASSSTNQQRTETETPLERASKEQIEENITVNLEDKVFSSKQENFDYRVNSDLTSTTTIENTLVTPARKINRGVEQQDKATSLPSQAIKQLQQSLTSQSHPLLGSENSLLQQDELSTLIAEKTQELQLPSNPLNGFAQSLEDPRPFVDNAINLVQLHTQDSKNKK